MNPQFLKRVDLFRGLDDTELADILMLGVVKDCADGEILFEEGTAGDRIYVIYRGAVRISRILQHVGEEALTLLQAGEFFGEMSFFDEEPRSARAIAHGPTQLLVIRNADLKTHLESRPEVALRFLWSFCRTLSQRVRDTNSKFSTLFAISRVF